LSISEDPEAAAFFPISQEAKYGNGAHRPAKGEDIFAETDPRQKDFQRTRKTLIAGSCGP
jgi:hypothetical protein